MWEILASGGELLWKLKQQVPLSLEYFLQPGFSSGAVRQPRLDPARGKNKSLEIYKIFLIYSETK